MLSHMEFNETGLPNGFFNRTSIRLKTLSIGLCTQSDALQVNSHSLDGLEETLENLMITDCNMDMIPTTLESYTRLNSLSLARNRLTTVPKNSFAALENLVSLNLAGNFIASMEEGTLAQINKSLEVLILGEHNFINESIFNEIAQLRNLKVLDLSKADGISEFPVGIFEKLTKLEKLLLMGCSLTTITNQTFRGLNNLIELDLRVNLIREMECAAFQSIPNIRRLSLAGNYLNITQPCFWNDLNKIEELDLSWNELSQLPAQSFSQLGKTLRILNLRHNTNLTHIDDYAFDNLTNVIRLNLSNTAITNVNAAHFASLISLQAIDLSNSQLHSVVSQSFAKQFSTLQQLMLNNNQLRTLPPQFIEHLQQLKQLDISSNLWLCDEAMKNVITEINEKYAIAAQTSKEFLLINANNTICDRPYSLRGEVITDIDSNLLVEYNPIIDTTTTTTTQRPITTIDIDTTNTLFTFFPNEAFIGKDDEQGNSEHSKAISGQRAPPEYDINVHQTLTNNSDQQFMATLIALGVMLAVSAAVTIAVVLYVKKRKSENTDHVADTEMDARPSNGRCKRKSIEEDETGKK
ncbi:unnamed protein product [Anisakis simplex]|uniref:LRRCT domain-containing protein n=1 Tax=Anisakis simplex TaxID=6269 RepID=A0A158PNT1_ANISI|nr:unnamed protein product [Anisakis simplex]